VEERTHDLFWLNYIFLMVLKRTTKAVNAVAVKGDKRYHFFHINEYFVYFNLKPEEKRSLERTVCRCGIISGDQMAIIQI
jgi:hypothetical protein